MNREPLKKRHYYELSNGRCAQAVPGPTAALNLLPNAFASEHINILPHYIYRSSWLSMSFATVSSTLGKKTKKNKAQNKNPLLPIKFAHCSQRDTSNQTLCPQLNKLCASARTLHAVQHTAKSHALILAGENHLQTDIINCSWNCLFFIFNVSEDVLIVRANKSKVSEQRRSVTNTCC